MATKSKDNGKTVIPQRRSTGGEHQSTLEAFQALAKQPSSSDKYLLRLYVAGTTTKASRAIENVRRICEEHLAGRYELEVVDLYQQPTLSKGEQIIAVPTLIKKLPAPLRKFIGDMSDTDRILIGLDLRPKKA
jgi:circadian clock protein KaiB